MDYINKAVFKMRERRKASLSNVPEGSRDFLGGTDHQYQMH